MSKAAGRSATVLIAERDLSTFFSSADSVTDVAPLETTGLGGSDRSYIPGLGGGTASCSGFFDGATEAVEQALSEALGSTHGEAVTIGPRGLAVGAMVRTLLARHTRFSVSSPVDGVCAVAADIQASNGVQRGHALHALELEDESGTEAAVDNGAATTAGGAAHLHVTAADDDGGEDTLDVQIEGSTTGAFAGEETVIAAFSTVEGSPWSERVEVSGTIPRYLRAAWQKDGGGSGNWTFAVAFGRW